MSIPEYDAGWEYKQDWLPAVFDPPLDPDRAGDYETPEAFFARMGVDRWELVATIPRSYGTVMLIFKRPLQPTTPCGG